ncbi:MAG: hypothetical protein D6776_03620 [Planctomycetota bacterium]|nr:MAG: hypothetical protein D6776_03620 [Planctomycetota bacterium]
MQIAPRPHRRPAGHRAAAPLVLVAVLLAPTGLALAQSPRPVPPPRGFRQGQLGRRRTPPPPVEVIEDPDVALVIDDEVIDRRRYGEALIREYGLRYLETYVRAHLVERRARALGVTVNPEAVEREAARRTERILARRYRGNRKAMQAALASLGLRPEDWERGLRRRVRQQLLTEAVVRADRDVSEPRLRKRYRELYGEAGIRRTVREIVFTTELWRSRLFPEEEYRKQLPEIERAAERKAQTLRKRLVAGEDFATLARAESDDPMAQRGGDYGAFWRRRYGPEVDRVIERTPIGEITPVLRTRRGFVIAQPYGEREGWSLHARHILLSTELRGKTSPELVAARRKAARDKAQQLLAALRDGADFAALAREHSDDLATRASGGDLGETKSGQLPAALETALLALEPGAVGGPVETPLGFHIVQLLDKRRRPELDERLVRMLLVSTEYLKVKQRRLGARLETLATERALEVVKRLGQGASAEQLARELSEDPNAQRTGGLLPLPLPPDTDPAIREAIAQLAPNDRIRTVKTRRGVHVLVLEDYEQASFEQARPRLIEEIRSKPVTPEEVETYLERLRRAAHVKRGPMG